MSIVKLLTKLMLALIVIGLVAFAIYSLASNASSSSGPWNLKAGVYLGSVPAEVLGEYRPKDVESVELVLDYSQPPQMVLLLKGERIAPLVADLSQFEQGGAVESKVILKVKKSRLEFESPAASPIDLGGFRRYSGRVRNLDTGFVTDWFVEAKDADLSSSDQVDAKQFLRWYGYISEIDQVLKAIEVGQSVVLQKQNEIDELEKLITNKGQLESYSDQRLAELKQEMVRYQQELKELTQVQDQLVLDLQSAQSLSQKGKLVSLNREFMQRQLDLLRLKQGEGSSATQFDPNVLKRGARIKSLLDEISQEQARINLLTARP